MAKKKDIFGNASTGTKITFVAVAAKTVIGLTGAIAMALLNKKKEDKPQDKEE